MARIKHPNRCRHDIFYNILLTLEKPHSANALREDMGRKHLWVDHNYLIFYLAILNSLGYVKPVYLRPKKVKEIIKEERVKEMAKKAKLPEALLTHMTKYFVRTKTSIDYIKQYEELVRLTSLPEPNPPSAESKGSTGQSESA